MQIPKRFKIFGQTFEVVFDPLLIHRDNNSGESHHRTNQIKLQPSVEGWPKLSTHIEADFFHELFHIIFNMLGEVELRDNDKLVDLISQILHQILITAEYE